jgi:hypothetical protein
MGASRGRRDAEADRDRRLARVAGNGALCAGLGSAGEEQADHRAASVAFVRMTVTMTVARLAVKRSISP